MAALTMTPTYTHDHVCRKEGELGWFTLSFGSQPLSLGTFPHN
jgi:hypothetical protein